MSREIKCFPFSLSLLEIAKGGKIIFLNFHGESAIWHVIDRRVLNSVEENVNIEAVNRFSQVIIQFKNACLNVADSKMQFRAMQSKRARNGY